MSPQRVAIVGAGKIGEALIAGLIDAGRAPTDLYVVEHSGSRREELAHTYGIRTVELAAAIEVANVVVIAVKPDAVDGLLAEFGRATDGAPEDQVIVTVVAGIPAARYEQALYAGAAVVRVMPNTPMLVGAGMSGVSAGRWASPEQVQTVVKLMESVGSVVVVPEAKMHAVTAISGSGPAYLFLVAEAMIDAGVDLGLTRAQATQLATHTIAGAGRLMVESDAGPTELRAAVSSPGGTTSAAIRTFERNGLRSAVIESAYAAAERSRELGAKFD